MKHYALAGLRIFLGIVFVFYAAIKFLGIQFPKMEIDQNLNQIDGVSLVWYFFGYSQHYMIVVASGELLTGIRIAVPKTTKIGVLFYFPFALNIAAVNWCFDLPYDVKILSAFLALSSFYLLLNDSSAYKKLLA